MNKNSSTPAKTPESEPLKTDDTQSQPVFNGLGGAFDNTPVFSDLKRLQDPAKFSKARFSFRLYRK
jgi:hypothetical protein